METFGDKLRKARERKGYSQTEVYKRVNINNKTLSRYEKGGSEPDYETLKILAALYEVNIEELIGVGKKDDSIEETESERMKREIREIVNMAKTDEDIKSILHIVKKVMKE